MSTLFFCVLRNCFFQNSDAFKNFSSKAQKAQNIDFWIFFNFYLYLGIRSTFYKNIVLYVSNPAVGCEKGLGI